MTNKVRHNLAGPVWKLSTPNKAGLRSLVSIMTKGKKSTKKLPRYVQARKLKSGNIAYYWCPPHWARKNEFPLISEALGSHLDKSRERIKVLNAYLDKWRIHQRLRGG